MTRSRQRTDFGIAAAVLGVAVCVTCGSAVDSSPAVLLPRVRASEPAGRVIDRQAVQQWLSVLADAAKSLRDGGAGKLTGSAAALVARSADGATLNAAQADAAGLGRPAGPPPAFVHAHLIDLPPPAC